MESRTRTLALRPLGRLCATLALASALTAQQRPLVDITPGLADHRDATISPDGQWVAYRTGNTLGVVSIAGQAAVTVHTGTVQGGFLWSRSSGTLFLAEAGALFSTPRNASNATQIASFGTATVTLWDLDTPGTTLFCTRYEPSTATYTAFRVASSGASVPVDLFSSQDEIFGLRIDPSGQYLLHLERVVAPFSPISVKRTDLAAQSTTDLVPGPLGTQVSDPAWLDAGDTALCATQDGLGRVQAVQLERLTGRAVPLTGNAPHSAVRLSPDRQWILTTSVDGQGGNGPTLLPVVGGGEVMLHTAEPFAYGGAPGIDLQARRVVFSARRLNAAENLRIFRLDLDREIVARPRCPIGSVLTLELPANANEIGVLFLGLRQPSFTLAGIAYGFDLGANFAILTIAAGGAQPITFSIPVPPDPGLSNLLVDYQGLRVDTVAHSAAFTRSGRFVIF